MLRRAKLAVLETMRSTGAMRFVSRTHWRGQRLLILCYHGVSMFDEHAWDSSMFIPPKLFETRLKLLREGGFNVLPLGEALLRLERNDLPPKAVVITFDDGLADFYYEAFPLLRSYKMPATVYLATYHCYNQIPVFGMMVRYLMWRARLSTPTIQNTAFGWTNPQSLATPESILSAYRLLDEVVTRNRLSADEKESLAKALAAHLNLDYEEISGSKVLHLMTPEQVREIHNGGISIELHTHRHRTPHDPTLFNLEINENREKIQAITGVRPLHFCYPSGVWRPEMLQLLSDAGVASATTCSPGIVTPATSHLLLPRHIDTTLQSSAEFEGWLSGVSQFLPKRNQNREY